jgi:uncharacterized protein YndB with AHSA1/START domain
VHDGRLITLDGRPALRFERRYRQPVERVWRAVTEPEEMARWFPAQVVGERAVGAPLTFDDDAQRAAANEAGEPTRADGPMFTGAVVTYDPPNVFAFTWGDELIRLELARDGEGTLLTFTQVLSHQSVAARNGAGWHMCLLELDRLVEGTEPDGAAAEGDEDFGVYHEYLDRMGPSLGELSADGSVTWDRATHVEPERVLAVLEDRDSWSSWGAGDRTAEPVRWEVAEAEAGTRYRVTHEGIGADAELAARWHALLAQLDMFLAAGVLIPVDAQRWVAGYRSLLRSPSR